MKNYQMVLIALGLGAVMATLYVLEVIPAWLCIALGWIGGIAIYKVFR